MGNRISIQAPAVMTDTWPVRCVLLLGICSMWINTGWAARTDRGTGQRNNSSAQRQLIGGRIDTPDQNDSSKSKAASAIKEIEKLKQEMLTLAHELVKDFPQSNEVRIWQGNVYNLLGQTAKAVQILEEALQKEPHKFELLHILGETAFEQEGYDKAIAYWRRALDVNPRLPGFNASIGQALLEKGEIPEAIAALQQELQIAPRSGKAHYLLGQCHLQLQDYEKARQYYLEAVKIAPANSTAYFGLFTVCRRLQRMQEAKQYMVKFKAIKKEGIDEHRRGYSQDSNLNEVREGAAMMILGASELYRKSKNLPKARSLVTWALRLEPENMDGLRRQVMLHQITGRFQEALDTAEKMRKLEPKNPEYYHTVGMLAWRLRQTDRAQQAFQALKSMIPDRAIGYRELARLYLSTATNFPEALELARQALALEPSAANYHLLSWACARNGQKEPALAAMKRATDLAPDNAQYRQMYEQMLRQRW